MSRQLYATVEDVPAGLGRSAHVVSGERVIVLWAYDIVKDQWQVRADCAAKRLSVFCPPVPVKAGSLKQSIRTALRTVRRGLAKLASLSA